MRNDRRRREVRVLLVDESREALAALNKQFTFADVVVAGESAFGPVAYTWANQLKPDIVVVAVEDPVARALKTVELLSRGQPRWPVIVVSSLSDHDNLRKAMVAGADDHIPRSADPEDLHTAILALFAREQQRQELEASGGAAPFYTGTIICVFGVKGGIGKTTLSTNLAASIAVESKQRVVLVDLDLQFGDVALMMNTPPEKTILDVVEALHTLDSDLVDGFLAKHSSGVRVLPAPVHVDGSEQITGDHVRKVLGELASVYDYVILDTPGGLNETVLAALDMSNLILLVTTPEFLCVKRTKACLDLMRQWQYSEEKVKLVINKANGRSGANPEDIVGVLRYPAFWKLPLDPAADSVIGPGGLVVQDRTKARAEMARSIFDLTRKILGANGTNGHGLVDKMTQKFFLARR